MLKKILKIILMFAFFLLIFSISKEVQANSISQLSMEIYIDTNGNATVTEIWTCYTDTGTEVYHPYYNLGNSEIKNLTVSEDGRTYKTLSSWDTSGTLEDKAYTCGINQITDGVELCWGISTYGSHVYTVSYTISNFVSELTDSQQMIYWTLIPQDFSNSIGQVYIKIYADFDIPNSTEVYGYGKYGATIFVNDYIEMQSNGSLDTDEYITLLVNLPSNTFNTSNKLNYDFNYYYEMAQKGSTKYNHKATSIIDIIDSLFTISFVAIVIAAIVIIIRTSIKAVESGLHFGEEGRKMPDDLSYYRDIPCNKDIFRASYIAYKYGLLTNKSYNSFQINFSSYIAHKYGSLSTKLYKSFLNNLFGAIILKWIKDSVIKVEQKEKKNIFNKENMLIYFNEINSDTTFTNEKEKLLFELLYEASQDGVLDDKKFKKWCNKHYSKITKCFEDILKEQENLLIKEGMITIEEKTKKGLLRPSTYNAKTATYALKQEAIQLAGLKKYLQEYTLIEDRKAIEATLFEEYLIFAQLLGIAKQVTKDFKDIYPEIVSQSKFSSYDNIIFISTYVTHTISTTVNNSKSSSASGGGGGGSFGGGGGRRWFPLI